MGVGGGSVVGWGGGPHCAGIISEGGKAEAALSSRRPGAAVWTYDARRELPIFKDATRGPMRFKKRPHLTDGSISVVSAQSRFPNRAAIAHRPRTTMGQIRAGRVAIWAPRGTMRTRAPCQGIWPRGGRVIDREAKYQPGHRGRRRAPNTPLAYRAQASHFLRTNLDGMLVKKCGIS